VEYSVGCHHWFIADNYFISFPFIFLRLMGGFTTIYLELVVKNKELARVC
jgi:hypothetical protein